MGGDDAARLDNEDMQAAFALSRFKIDGLHANAKIMQELSHKQKELLEHLKLSIDDPNHVLDCEKKFQDFADALTQHKELQPKFKKEFQSFYENRNLVEKILKILNET